MVDESQRTRSPSKLPPPHVPSFPRSLPHELPDASTAEMREVPTGQLETVSAEFEATLEGLKLASPGTPSQIRSLEGRDGLQHTPRHAFDALLDTTSDTDTFSQNARADVLTRRAVDSGVHTPRASADALLHTLPRTSDNAVRTKRVISPADEETLDRAPASAPTHDYDSSELPTANNLAIGPSKPIFPVDPSETDLRTLARRSEPRDAFFFVDRDSEPTLAREVALVPVVPHGKQEAFKEPFSDSHSMDAFSPSTFLNDDASGGEFGEGPPPVSLAAISVGTGDLILPTKAPVATQPIQMRMTPDGRPLPPGEPSSSGSVPGGATFVLASQQQQQQRSSSHPPPAHSHSGAPPAPPVQPRASEDTGGGYPPLRFGGDAARGYHPAPAPQWGPPPTAVPAPAPQLRAVAPAPVSIPAPPPRTLLWVALGLVLGAGIVLAGYRYLLFRPIDPTPTGPSTSSSVIAPPPIAPSLDPALAPPLNVQSTPVSTGLPTATAIPTAAPTVTAVPSATAATRGTPPSHAAPPSKPAAKPQGKAPPDGPPMPRPLVPDPPPAPAEPPPGQSILDNAL